jgi:hypothetical protein
MYRRYPPKLSRFLWLIAFLLFVVVVGYFLYGLTN